MIIIFASTTVAPVTILNMALVVVQIFEAVIIPVLRALTRPVVKALGEARTRLGGGEIFGVGSLDPPRFAVTVPRPRARWELASSKWR